MIRLPADEGALRSMLGQGLLDEGHALELKRELRPGTAANKELARDLAQFTIDGGVLIIGVDEGDGTTPPSLTPVDLPELSERIEEVAANRVDPPLHVRIQTIRATGQPGKGYLLVIVPPTPSKVHMVDGRYWGRGEKTRYPLSDGEVQRYHQLVLKGQRDATDLLDAEVRRDPAAAARLTAAVRDRPAGGRPPRPARAHHRRIRAEGLARLPPRPGAQRVRGPAAQRPLVAGRCCDRRPDSTGPRVGAPVGRDDGWASRPGPQRYQRTRR
jgi:hypothetical protein